MKVHRVFRTSLRALRRNPLRAGLTTLGIIIGVAAVIAVMEIGNGSSAAVQQAIASMGANCLWIWSGQATSNGASLGAGSIITLSPQDAEAIAQECPAVIAVSPAFWTRHQLVYGNQNWVPRQMMGVTPPYLLARSRTVSEGSVFTDDEVRNAAKVCLIGPTVVEKLFGGLSPMGKEIRIHSVNMKVIGVLSAKGADMWGNDQDDIVLAPWTTIMYRICGQSMGSVNQSANASAGSAAAVNTLNQFYPNSEVSLYPQPSAIQAADTPLPVRFVEVDSILARARSAEDIHQAIAQITRLLRQRHHIAIDKGDDFIIRDLAEFTKTRAEATETITSLLLWVALISLVVGGVGIMNIMLVSVTERTHEIGLRMAVGARGRDILAQFLIEAVLLCLVGGAAGIGTGILIAHLVTKYKNWPTQISVGAILIAVLVSFAIGVVFGFYPAWKASRMDPIEALRYE